MGREKLAVLICVVLVVVFFVLSQIGNTTNMEQPSASEDHRDDDSDLVTTLNLKFMLPECRVFSRRTWGVAACQT